MSEFSLDDTNKRIFNKETECVLMTAAPVVSRTLLLRITGVSVSGHHQQSLGASISSKL